MKLFGSSKLGLSDYLAFLQALPPEHRVLQPIGEQNYFGDTYSCGGATTTQAGTARDHDALPSPTVLEGTYLVIPEASWAAFNAAWSDVQNQLSTEAGNQAEASFGTQSICTGTADQQIDFLTWFIPQIRSYTWLYWLGAAAGAAFVGGLVWSTTKTGGRRR